MVGHRAPWLPWALVALAAAMAVVATVVSIQNAVAAGQHMGALQRLQFVAVLLVPLAFTAVGAFVVTRRPGNRIGWLMVAIGLSFAYGAISTDYAGVSAQTHRPTRPFGVFVAWTESWIFLLYFFAVFLLLLLFPTGEIPSRRWKPLVWAGLSAFAGAGITGAVRPGPIENLNQPMENPYAIAGFPPVINTGFSACALLALAAAALSLILRFRTARGDVRQQLKWFTYGGAIAIAFDIATAIGGPWGSPLGLLALLATSGVPVCIGIAILRYRLYDIDVLVNRTLVYGSLSASLALFYFLSVVSLQALFRSVAGPSSDLAVAVSTLAIAALFQPLRRGIQVFIDRRFYRRKYDAARTLAVFQSRLRNEVDLDELTSDLVGVVHDTVQPAHVSLWIRDGGRS